MNEKKLYSKKFSTILKYIFIDIVDLCIFSFSMLASIYITNQGKVTGTVYSPLLYNYIHSIILAVALLLIYKLLGVQRSIWHFAGIDEIVRCSIASVLINLFWYLLDRVVYLEILDTSAVLPFYAYVASCLFTTLLTASSRLLFRFAKHFQTSTMRSKGKNRVMIVGAGFMGSFIINEMRNSFSKNDNNNNNSLPILAVDDDKSKIGKKISGIKIKGTCNDIPKLAKKENIDTIIICIPSAPKLRQKEIIEIAMKTNCKIKISPSINEFLEDGKKKKIRNVEISDLLSRPEVQLNKKVCSYITNKTILVTGGGGSIGSELCRQAAKYFPKQIIIFDIYENCAFELLNDLKDVYGNDINIQVQIGSVRDVNRLDEVFKKYRPNVVFHAAAHKHVPLMENSPCEAVKNNVFGTYNTALISDKYNVEKFVLLSTDKAVNPTNVMGATKRITEFTVEYFNSFSKTCYTAVRFGNVLGSNGSVVPIFKKQIEKGGPVCVTDERITRYFMTIPEAAQLVCQAGGIAKGGEIFVLDMGEPVKIMDLAKNLIKLSGFTEDEIPIKIIGLRPGEKLYEELATKEEISKRTKTKNNKIFITPQNEISKEKFEMILDKLKNIDNNNIKTVLKEILPEYQPN